MNTTTLRSFVKQYALGVLALVLFISLLATLSIRLAHAEDEAPAVEATVEVAAPAPEPAVEETAPEPEPAPVVEETATAVEETVPVEEPAALPDGSTTEPDFLEADPPAPAEETSSEQTTTSSASAEATQAPELSTEKEDYHPGETATIFGRFFGSLQNIILKVFGSDDNDENYTETEINVTADASGIFSATYNLDTTYRPFYEIVATSLEGDILATDWFRDAAIGGYDQCANDDGDGYNSNPGTCDWINGAINGNNSSYQEGDSTVQRLELTGFAPGSQHTVTLQYGTTKQGKHAYDFLTSWDHSEDWLTVSDRCDGIVGCTTAAETTFPIPNDLNESGQFQGTVGLRNFAMRGGTITSAGAPTLSGSYAGDSETTILLTFNAADSGPLCSTKGQVTSCSVVLWFGAHVAETSQWQPFNGTTGATSINGAPYHVAIVTLDGGSIGNRDNQMQADAIIPASTITIHKVAPGGGQTAFNFDANGTGFADFSLVDGGSTSVNVVPGNYSVAELANTPGWHFVSVACTESGQGTSATENQGTRSAAIVIGANGGATVDCVFTNAVNAPLPGNIIVDKVTLPAGSSQSFNFDAVGDGYNDFALTDAAAPNNQQLAPGNYSVSETVPAGWDQTSASCVSSLGDTETIGNLELDEQETITCTFTNTQRGHIIVDKVTNPSGSQQSFNFTTTGTGYNGFSLTDQAAANNQEVVPGAYTVAETAVAGWTSNGGVCDQGETPGSLDVGPGETVTCTFTNTQDATLTLVKEVINDNGGTATEANFQAKIDNNNVPWGVAQVVSAGAHTASEVTLPTYTASSWGGDCAANGSVTLSPGQNKTCSITNNDIAPKLTVTKVVVNDNGGTKQVADFPLFVGNTQVTSGVQNSFTAASYIVSETQQTGYTASAWSGDCDANGNVSLSLGEVKSCTITNNDNAPSLTLVKQVVNDHGGAAVATDWILTADGPTDISGAGGATSDATFDAGTYALSESTGPSGYTAGAWSCVGGTQDGSNITVALGQSATCTIINNDIAPTLTLVKTVVNNNGGSATAANFQAKINGGNVPWGVAQSLSAGAYTASETTLPGYTASAWGTDCAANGSVTLSIGENKTCTITNDDQQAFITVVKVVENDNGGSAQPNDFALKLEGNAVSSGVAVPVNPGTYTASETLLSGYTFDGFSGDCDSNGDVTVALGESKTCTLTNDDQQSYVVVNKTVINDNGGTAGPNDFLLKVDGNAVLDEVAYPVNPGTHTASETALPGYIAGAWGGDCDAQGSVSVALGQTKTCTITNDDDAPMLTLVKVVDGEAAPSAFTLAAAGPTGFSGVGPSVPNGASFDAGTYNLSETGPSGYLASDWVCVGGTQNDSDTVTVGLGQDATCTITNTQILALNVTKTAATTFTRTHNWTIEKIVDDPTVDLFVGDSQTVNYDVTATKTGFTDSAWAVSGTITITNPNELAALAATITSVTDAISNQAGNATVSCPGGLPQQLAPGASLVCTYSKALTDGDDELNTATVATSGLVPGGSGNAAVDFGAPTTVVNDSINVNDTFDGGDFGPVSSTTTHEYSRVLACGSEQGQYQGQNNQVPNTATITQTGQSDDAQVVVNCYGLTVTKDASTSYTKTWTWNIGKIGDQTNVTLSPGQSYPVNYDVIVNATPQDSAWAVAGTITVANPAPIAATLSGVTDALTGGINATVNCPSTTVAANSSLVCTYSSALPDATNRTNTATATLSNGTPFSGMAPVSFVGATVNEVDETITINDDKYGNLGQVSANQQLPKIFEYTMNVGPYETTACGTTQAFVNTATFTTNDSGATGNDNHTVNAAIQCVCSLTQGYWKTHNDLFKGGAPSDDTWNLLPQGPNTVFFLSGKSWFNIFWTAPKGNAYYNLAHQYMATKLNILNGASAPAQVTAALAQAEAYLAANTPAQTDKAKGPVKQQLTNWAGIFGAFNEGLTNPAGHCSEIPA